ncbi:folliculin-interacting protein 2 [Diorhabda sublineata]|uniref:folliculin-interacting protein 2 n=1 Tax=Diorhabda sublineata TaxID=1163346 RepID=UPI0024E12999|nr:folliculin-interacting protein 2 [Diorhabda sublineata]
MAYADTCSAKKEENKYVHRHVPTGENLNLKCPASENVRILLFKECPLSDRELIFDSNLTKIQNCITNNEKNNSEELSNLTELIFGSAAMKYQETYYKIHDISSPQQIIFTQVFSSPKKFRPNKTSSNQPSTSFLSNASLQDYNSSFASSISQASLSSKSSNSFSLILRNNSTATTIDSGFSDFSSNSSLNRSYESFARRRSTCGSFFSDSESSKSLALNFNNIRLGLALILHKPEKNPLTKNLYIQNIPIIESILWRVRQYVEIALNSPRLFLSTMIEISVLSAKWLTKELNFWTKTESVIHQSYYGTLMSIFKNRFPRSLFFKYDEQDEKFESFCQTVQELERKETNFFLSTLLTAVLTHHTGWIATCYHLENLSVNESYHVVWKQLTNLYGATGYLTKTSKTVIYGLKNENTIKKVLNFIQYFMRFFKIERRYIERSNIIEENKIVDEICTKVRQDSIPNEFPMLRKSGLLRTKTNEVDLTKLVDDENKRRSICKSKAVNRELSALNEESDLNYEEFDDKPVLFILGDHEKLQNLKKPQTSEPLQSINEIIKDSRRQMETKKLKIVKFPLPKFEYVGDVSEVSPNPFLPDIDFFENFVPDKAYQGTNIPKEQWKNILSKDLSLKKSCLFPDEINEKVVILGDTDKWDVQVWSSLRRRMIKNEAENIVDSSPLVSNMLEVIIQMRKLNMSKEQCTTFMEQKLIEICLRANALTEFLLTTDFCSMDVLLKTLNLNIVDIPLLMSVGSNIDPRILQKYGLSYQ